jgi:putative transcriptional regulator
MPKPAKKSFKTLQGQLLLDGGSLGGSCFHRSVVLVCEHTPEGALGLVLNQPGTLALEDSLPGDIPPAFHGVKLFEGGPVQPTALSYLYSNPGHLLGNVLPQLTIGHQIEELQELMNSGAPDLRLKVFSGYAGWAPGQLDNEMRQGSWLTAPADLPLVFEIPPQDLWKRLLRQRIRWQERILAEAPEDIAFN